jgi:hypothetical protein
MCRSPCRDLARRVVAESLAKTDRKGEIPSGRMGVHLAFFLHISSAPDQANNILALAFGVFVSGLIIFGSIMIMAHLDHNMMPMDELMKMQR